VGRFFDAETSQMKRLEMWNAFSIPFESDQYASELVFSLMQGNHMPQS